MVKFIVIQLAFISLIFAGCNLENIIPVAAAGVHYNLKIAKPQVPLAANRSFFNGRIS